MVLLDVVYNHFGPDGQLPARVRAAVLHRPRTTRRGARRSTSTASRRARCASSSSTTRSTGSRSSTSTACASTRCTRSSTTRAAHFVDELARGGARRPGRERHVHLVLENDAQRRRAASSATRRRAAARPRSGTTTSHHALPRAADRRERRLLRRLRATTRAASRRAASPRASPTRARPRRIATASRAASRAATCRRPPSSPSCRTTTRSATAPSASGLRRLAAAARCGSPTARAAARAVGAAAVHGRGVRRRAAVPVLLRLRGRPRARRCAKAAAASSRRSRASPTPRAQARRSPIPTPRRRSSPRSCDWQRWTAPAHAEWLEHTRSCSRCARREIVPRIAAASRTATFETLGASRPSRWTGRSATARGCTCARISATAPACVPRRRAICCTARRARRRGARTLRRRGAAPGASSATLMERASSAWRALYGIEPATTTSGATGARPPSDTLRALLARHGRRARDPQAVERRSPPTSATAGAHAPADHRRAHARARRGMRIHLPQASLARPLAWRITSKSGEIREEASARCNLAVLEDHAGATCAGARARLPAARGPRRGLSPPARSSRATPCLAGHAWPWCPSAATCRPRSPTAARVWGAAVQLYGVRSRAQLGHRRFQRLRACVEVWGARGAGIVGINPLHALFPHDPENAQPLQPVEPALPQPALHRRRGGRRFRRERRRRSRAAATLAQFQCEALRARATELVDYPARGRGQAARCSKRSTRHFRAQPPRAAARARARAFARSASARRGAAPARAVRSAAGAFPRATAAGAGRRGPRSTAIPVARACARFARGAPRARRLPRVPAVAGATCSSAPRRRAAASSAWRSACTWTSPSRSTAAARRAGRNQDLYALGVERRRAARRVQPQGPGLGTAAAARRGALRDAALRALHRHAARQHARTPARCASTT